MLFLDCEFSSFRGKLISMGICSDLHKEEFYEVLPLPSEIHPWVVENVVPYLIAEHIEFYDFQQKLYQYLAKHSKEVIVADWPEDFVHLLESICGPNGSKYNVELKMKLLIYSNPKPEVPHNALSDARALRDWYKKNHKE